LVIENVGSSPYGGQLIEGAQQAAQDEGYTLMVVSSAGDGLGRDNAFRALRENHVEGIIFAPLMISEGDPSSDWRRSPLVLIDQSDSAEVLTSISADEYLAMRRLTRLALANGHRRIGFLVASGESSAIRRRSAAITDEVACASGIELQEHIAEPTVEGGYGSAMGALRSPLRPTVLLCYNDLMAAGAYRAVAELGLRIPGDVSVVGFGDESALGESLLPPLTTVGLPHAQMGAAAVRAVLDVIEDRATTTPAVECTIVLRDSLGPALSWTK
jgi:LacI family transcriptional regulator